MTDQSPTGIEWNARSALANVDGVVADLKELLEIWLRRTPQLLSDIRTALDNNDFEKLQLAAHTLKGSLMILDAEDCCSGAAELEQAGRTGQTLNAFETLTRLEDQISSIHRQAIEFVIKN